MVKGRKQKAAGLVGRCLLVGVGIVGLASMSGCESATPQEKAALSILTGLASVSPDLKPGERAAVSIGRQEINIERQRDYAIEAAREGRTEVNVNVGGNLPPDYFIVTDLGTGDSKVIPGTQWWPYIQTHKEDYPNGHVLTVYRDYKRTITLRSKGSEKEKRKTITSISSK